MSFGGAKRARRTVTRCVFIASLTALCATLAHGFEPTSMRFDRLSMADGLSQSAVMAIAQDQTGFMWFGTESGLDRYDGFDFKNYRRQRGNARSLGGEFVRDLDLADDGSLWVATDGGGVSRWHPESDTFSSYNHDPDNENSLASDRVRRLLADARGYVWIATRDSGLDRLAVDSGEITHYTQDAAGAHQLSNNEVFALAIDSQERIWIGTRSGLNLLDPATGEISRPGSSGITVALQDAWVRSLLVDEAGVLWIGTHRDGLYRLDQANDRIEQYVSDDSNRRTISSNRVEVIFEDDRQRVWIGTDNGLNLMDAQAETFTRYLMDPTDSTSLSSNYIWSIFQDEGGMLWVGTRSGGVNKWNPRSWSFGHFKPAAADEGTFSNPNVTSFTEDQDGNLWVGTFGGGINVMQGASDTIVQIRHEPDNPAGLRDDRVMALLTDSRGEIWAGTMTGGLNRIDPASGKITTYRHADDDTTSLAADGIMSLLEDSQGRLWVGTFGGGISRLDGMHEGGSDFRNYGFDPDDPAALASPRATTIVEDHNGVVWVGTDGGGLHWMDSQGDSWHRLQHNTDDPGSISGDTIYGLHVDSAGVLWVGTRGGLDKLVGSTESPESLQFQNVSRGQGLASNAVYTIESDAEDNLWLGTNNGLTRYNPNGGDARSFHKSQGLQGEEFNFGASYAGKNGRLYFGGSNGFNAFTPSELEFGTKRPAVVLTSLSVLNTPVPTQTPYEHINRIELDYSDDVVTFGISALDFAAPEANRYAYRLEGFDDAWVDAGAERRITYTNLDGGTYRLHISAANSDGVWNSEGISIPLIVAHPPWKTWWAYLLYGLTLATALFGLWRRQEQKLRREAEYSRRLEHEVHSRTRLLNDRNKDLKEANVKLIDASTTDPLTGLRNRRFLYEQIAKDVDLVLRHYRDGTETIRPGGNNDLLFLMVDLDNFKPVNDKCGHEAGDELLLQIRDVLQDACRFSDDVIRWGGDEFLVVARETNRKFAATLAERIRSSLAQRVFPVGHGQVARVTSSIGYASYPFIKERPDLLTWEEVLGVADAAMYEAKQKRNAWMGIEGIRWDEDSNALCAAIKDDPGGLAEEGIIRAIESLEESAENYA